MPRGGARPGAGRPRKNLEAAKAAVPAKPKAKKPAADRGLTLPNGQTSPDAPPGWPFGTKPPEQPVAAAEVDSDDGLTDEERAGLEPLQYLLAVMRSPRASKSARLQAAIQAAPYMHAKPAPLAKKEGKAEQAKKAGRGKFGASSAPRLAAAGGKQV